MPPFQIAPCTIEDGPGLARNNVSAFWEDKKWAQVWTQNNKSREYAITQASARWPYNLIKDLTHRRRYEKVVDVSTGELVGYANWRLPEASAEGIRGEQELDQLWPEACGPRVDDRTRELLKKRFDDADWEFNNIPDSTIPDRTNPPGSGLGSKLRGDKKWLDLIYLAVHPDHQRQGVASLLLESGIRAAEKMGLDIFANSTKAGRPVYPQNRLYSASRRQ